MYDEKLEIFLREECSAYDYNVEGLVEEIKSVEVKKTKFPKFTMQIYSI